MNILLAHNYYQQPGGEDIVFKNEYDLLTSKGHNVFIFTKNNNEIEQMPKLDIGLKTIWNSDSYKKILKLITLHKPDIVHCHNTFPLISPSVYYACKQKDIPIIQTIHNYRSFCLNGMFLRDNRICEDCLNKPIPIPGIWHRCYRNDRLASATLATMLVFHRLLKTSKRGVTTYIVLTEFAKKKFIENGFIPKQLVVKPNFINLDTKPGSGKGNYAIFVGRLSPEKGITLLLDTWSQLGNKIPLKIVGSGPLESIVSEASRSIEGIIWEGRKNLPEVLELLGNAKFLIFPSIWYEGLPNTILESFSKGTPVIASQLGAMESLIPPRAGLLFTPNNKSSLIEKVNYFLDHPENEALLRSGARSEYEENYTSEKNYQMLMDIYNKAIQRKNIS